MFEGRSEEQKRACAEAVTKAWVETCTGKPESVHIVFVDVARSDWATGGRLMSDGLK
jgi:4-oxalocrotonate tautomerase